MTLRELRRELPKWQSLMRLKDWKVKLHWGRPVVDRAPDETKLEMAADCAGHIVWMPEYGEALILLQKGEGLHSMVHELFHLKLEGHSPKAKKYDPLYERALNDLTDAIIGEPEESGLSDAA